MASLGWYTSIGGKFLRSVPSYTVAVVIATLISQFSLLLAFFLPLKVVILLGSTSIPRYFPSAWQSLEIGELVIGLSAAAICFYFLHFSTERLIALGVERGSRRLLEKSHKITLFDNQDDIAARAYQRYVSSLAGIVFIALVCIALLAFYADLALLIAAYWLSVLLVFSLLYRFASRFRLAVKDGFSGLVGVLSGVGFLLVFTFIVADFLLGSAPEFLIALVMLILCRQLMQRLARVFSDIESLYERRLQVNALFFHSHVFSHASTTADSDDWLLLDLERRNKWIGAVLHDVLDVPVDALQTRWLQTGISGIFAFDVALPSSGGSGDDHYLVKLFTGSRRTMAQHEATLLLGSSELYLPAPEFLGVGVVEGRACHVSRLPLQQRLEAYELKSASLDLLARLLAVEPPSELVCRYGRSRPFLWQRLEANLVFSHLRLAAQDDDSLHVIERFEQSFEEALDILRALPLQLLNSETGGDALFRTSDGAVLACHWGRWSLDPVGSGWPIRSMTSLYWSRNFQG